MKRLTRRIGVFGGTGSMMSALGGKESVPAAPTSKPAGEEAAPPPAAAAAEAEAEAEAPKKRSWLGRIFGGDDSK
jgi:hypothetical protein